MHNEIFEATLNELNRSMRYLHNLYKFRKNESWKHDSLANLKNSSCKIFENDDKKGYKGQSKIQTPRLQNFQYTFLLIGVCVEYCFRIRY